MVAVDMGYGHQRAAYPLRHLSPTGKVVIANNYQGIPKSDFHTWNNTRRVYEFFSQMSNLPMVGGLVFDALDSFQEIKPFYPRRDMSAPNLQLRQMYYLIHRRNFCHHLIDFLNQEDIPLITTFFTVAFAAEEHKFKNDIYLVICDSDVSRAWVALNPQKSRIKYFAPCRAVVERLKTYGVPDKNIFLTGFPLPEENLGGSTFKGLKHDLAERVINLDPEHRYRDKYGETVKQFLSEMAAVARHHHPLTLTFAVGGAGAQRNIARDIVWSLRKRLLKNEIKLNLIAGSRNDVYCYFAELVDTYRLKSLLGKNLDIIFALEKEEYFRILNEKLRATDILWSKPSEMVFYSALGLPIIMAPSLGSQEVYNRHWLKTIGAGITQGDPRYTDEWLFDWINSGWLAEAAMSGFLDGRQFGVKNVLDVLFHGVTEPTKDDSLL